MATSLTKLPVLSGMVSDFSGKSQLWIGALLCGALAIGGCSVDARRAPPATQGQQPHLDDWNRRFPRTAPAPQIEAAATAPEDGQWIRPAKDFASSRYSGLIEITAQNVGSLKPAWSFNTGVLKGQEAAPIVVGHTMYVVTPYPNLLYAFDLSKPGPSVKWMYNPKPLTTSQGEACCDVVNRGADVRGWEDHLRDARQQRGRGRHRKRQGDLAHECRRHQQGRDA